MKNDQCVNIIFLISSWERSQSHSDEIKSMKYSSPSSFLDLMHQKVYIYLHIASVRSSTIEHLRSPNRTTHDLTKVSIFKV